MSSPKEQLEHAARAVATAVTLLKGAAPTMEALLKEARDMDNFGHVVDPTLWRDSERRAANAVVTPLFTAALDFIRAYDEQIAKSQAALAKVRA